MVTSCTGQTTGLVKWPSPVRIIKHRQWRQIIWLIYHQSHQLSSSRPRVNYGHINYVMLKHHAYTFRSYCQLNKHDGVGKQLMCHKNVVECEVVILCYFLCLRLICQLSAHCHFSFTTAATTDKRGPRTKRGGETTWLQEKGHTGLRGVWGRRRKKKSGWKMLSIWISWKHYSRSSAAVE